MMTLLNLDEFRLSAAEYGIAEAEDTQQQLVQAVTKLDSITIKLMNAACRAERNARAVEGILRAYTVTRGAR